MKRRKPKFKPLIMVRSEYVHFLGNNWRKMHGLPMKRYKSLTTAAKKRWWHIVDKFCELGNPGTILTADEIRRILL